MFQTKGIALQTKDLHVSMVTSAHVSNGADTVIGKNESFAKLMKISSRHLVNEKISAPTTAITIQELIDEERTTVTVGVSILTKANEVFHKVLTCLDISFCLMYNIF